MTLGLPITLRGEGYGIFIDWLGAKKALDDHEAFAQQLGVLYDLFYQHVRLHPLATKAIATTFGDTLYVETLKTAPNLQDPIAWTESLANELQQSGFRSVAYVTTGTIWNRIIDRGDLRLSQSYGATNLDGATRWGAMAHDELGLSVPLQIATIGNAAGAELKWGAGLYIQLEVFEALAQQPRGTVCDANGKRFHRL